MHDNTEKNIQPEMNRKDGGVHIFFKFAISFYWQVLVKSQVLFKG